MSWPVGNKRHQAAPGSSPAWATGSGKCRRAQTGGGRTCMADLVHPNFFGLHDARALHPRNTHMGRREAASREGKGTQQASARRSRGGAGRQRDAGCPASRRLCGYPLPCAVQLSPGRRRTRRAPCRGTARSTSAPAPPASLRPADGTGGAGGCGCDCTLWHFSGGCGGGAGRVGPHIHQQVAGQRSQVVQAAAHQVVAARGGRRALQAAKGGTLHR